MVNLAKGITICDLQFRQRSSSAFPRWFTDNEEFSRKKIKIASKMSTRALFQRKLCSERRMSEEANGRNVPVNVQCCQIKAWMQTARPAVRLTALSGLSLESRFPLAIAWDSPIDQRWSLDYFKDIWRQIILHADWLIFQSCISAFEIAFLSEMNARCSPKKGSPIVQESSSLRNPRIISVQLLAKFWSSEMIENSDTFLKKAFHTGTNLNLRPKF